MQIHQKNTHRSCHEILQHDRKRILHDKISKQFNIRIGKEEEAKYIDRKCHFLEATQLGMFLKEHGEMQSIVTKASVANGTISFEDQCLKYCVETGSNEFKAVIKCKLLDPMCFVWYINMKLQYQECYILYPPRAVQFVLKRVNNDQCFDFCSEVFNFSNSREIQCFPISVCAPCVQFIDIYLYGCRQKNPRTGNYMMSIDDIDVKGVQLNYLAQQVQQARLTSRISVRLTKASIVQFKEQLTLLQQRSKQISHNVERGYAYEDDITYNRRIMMTNQLSFKNIVNSFSVLHQTNETLCLIVLQTHIRHHNDSKNLCKCLLLRQDGNNMQRVSNSLFYNKW